jgi:hypothetical protein
MACLKVDGLKRLTFTTSRHARVRAMLEHALLRPGFGGWSQPLGCTDMLQ